MLSESLQRRSVSEQLILPVFRSAILLTDDTDPVTALHNLKLLQEEEPMLGIEYDPRTKQISAEIMGEVETEIIRNLSEKRFGMSISFGPPVSATMSHSGTTRKCICCWSRRSEEAASRSIRT